MSITQPPKPPDIEATTWHAIGAMYILKFLVPLRGAYLYYSVMGADPDKRGSRTEEMRAKNVDRILDLQAAEFLAQSSKTFDFDEKTSTPYRRGAQKQEEEEGPGETEGEELAVAEGDEGLAEAAARYFRATLTPKKPSRPDEESPTKETKGQTDFDGDFEATKWIKPPPGVHGHRDIQRALYDLLCTMGAANYASIVGGIHPTSPTCGTDLLRNINNAIAPVSTTTNTQAKRAYTKHRESFGEHTNFGEWWTTLLLLQMTKKHLKIDGSERIDTMNDAIETIEENTGPQSRWSLEIMAWNIRAQSEQTAAKGDEALITSFENAMRMHQQKRDLTSRPKEHAHQVHERKPHCTWCFDNLGKRFNNHSVANCRNKERAEKQKGGGGQHRVTKGKCFVCDDTSHQARNCPLIKKVKEREQALKTTTTESLEAQVSSSPMIKQSEQYSTPVCLQVAPSTSTRANAQFDTGATATMTAHPAFIHDGQASATLIEVADGRTLDSNTEGTFMATSNGVPLPSQRHSYSNSKLTTTLLSGPKIVYEHDYDVVLSKQHGAFMQPSSTACPICHPHDMRIHMEGSTDGFTLPLETVPSAPTEHAHHSKPTPPISNAELQRFGAVHAAMGGAVTRGNIGAFIQAYPEYADKMKLPKRFSDPLVANTIDPCHCCDRTKMTKNELPGEVEHHHPAPLEEIHLDLFTYPNDPRYDAIFIDRASRYVWHYALIAKSDLPKTIQQFIIDTNVLTGLPVGKIHYTITSANSQYGIDASAVNAYLESKNCPQRVKVLYTDGAGESASKEVESFMTDVNIKHRTSIPHSQHQNALVEHGGGWRLANMNRHDLDLSGLGPSFRRFCSALNAQRMVHVPHRALGNKTPAQVLCPHVRPQFRLFLPFGCQAWVLKGDSILKAKKLDPRGRSGVYIGTAAPYGMTGFLVYLFAENRRGAGQVVVATHAKFDRSFFPARKHNKRVRDWFTVQSAHADATFIEDTLREDMLREGSTTIEYSVEAGQIMEHTVNDQHQRMLTWHDYNVDDLTPANLFPDHSLRTEILDENNINAPSFSSTDPRPLPRSTPLAEQVLSEPAGNIPTAKLKTDSIDFARDHAQDFTSSHPPPADPTGYVDDESSSDDEDESPGGRKPPLRITTAEMDAAIQARLQAADRRIPAPDSPCKQDNLVTPTTFTSPEGGRTYRIPTSSDSPDTSDSVRPLTTTEEFDETIRNATQKPHGRQLRSGTIIAHKATPGHTCSEETVAAEGKVTPIETAGTGEQGVPELLMSSDDEDEDVDLHPRHTAFATKLKAAADEFHSSRVNDTRHLLHEAKVFAKSIRDKEIRVRAHSAKLHEQHALEAIEYIQALEKDAKRRKHRLVTDISTGERIDMDAQEYYDIGKHDISPETRIEKGWLLRVRIKTLKAAIKRNDTPVTHMKELHAQLKLLRTPKTAKEAMETPEWKEWEAAINKELQCIREKGVYEVRKIPPGRKAIPTKLVFKIKLKSDGSIDKFKCRCVALGFLQRAGLDFDPNGTYSPMSDPGTTRSVLSIGNALNLNIDHCDVETAYLYGVLSEKERFYCLPPAGFELPPGYGWYMLRGLYGTRQGGAVWSKTFRQWMKERQPQFQEAGFERCVYVFREHPDGKPVDLNEPRGIKLEPEERLIILVMNTDDMLIAYTDSAREMVDEFERTLNLSYKTTPRVPLEYYVGMHIVRDREKRLLSIDVRRHIYEFIRSMGLDPDNSASVSTPLDPNETWSKRDCPDKLDTSLRERVLRAHGKLIHMAIWARPDLAHAVSLLGRYIHNPAQKHWDAYIRIARYLIKTKDFRIVYGSHDTHGLVLYGFSDSDWAADLDDRKSTGAYVFFLDGAACSWKVKLSSTALLSSQESEYVAGSEATKEAKNLRMLLEHLGFGDPRPTDIYIDNKGAIIMGHHPSNKAATRHVDMRIHFMRQHVELGTINTPFCPTFDMVADFMTKATPKATHERHMNRTMGDQSNALPVEPIQHLVA